MSSDPRWFVDGLRREEGEDRQNVVSFVPYASSTVERIVESIKRTPVIIVWCFPNVIGLECRIVEISILVDYHRVPTFLAWVPVPAKGPPPLETGDPGTAKMRVVMPFSSLGCQKLSPQKLFL